MPRNRFRQRLWRLNSLFARYSCILLFCVINVCDAVSQTEEKTAATAQNPILALHLQIRVLSADLVRHQQMTQEKFASLEHERAELKRQIRLEELKQKTNLSLQTLVRSGRISEHHRQQTIRSALKHTLDILKTHLQQSLPYRQTERAATLSSMQSALTSKNFGLAIEIIMQFLETESKLGGEIEWYEAPIAFDEEPSRISDIIRLGMAMMLVRSRHSLKQEQQYGIIYNAGQRSKVTKIHLVLDTKVRQTIDALIAKLKSDDQPSKQLDSELFYQVPIPIERLSAKIRPDSKL